MFSRLYMEFKILKCCLRVKKSLKRKKKCTTIKSKTQIHFFGSMKDQMTRIQSFSKLRMPRHSHIHIFANQMSQKTSVPFFTIMANATQKIFSINICFFFKKWVWALRAHASAKRLPHLKNKNKTTHIFIEKNFYVLFAIVKMGLTFFETFGLQKFESRREISS